MKELSPDLLRILACPKCKASVVSRQTELQCSNQACGLAYPVRDGIPVMLIEEAVAPGGQKSAAGN